MGAEDNGLTLEALAHKLEALQRGNAENAQRLERLERENAELRHELTAPRGPGTRRNAPDEPRSLVPRRGEVPALRGSDRHGDKEADLSESSKSDGLVSRRRLLSKAGAAAAGLVLAGALTQRDIREAKATPTRFTTDTSNRGAVEGVHTANGYGVGGDGMIGVKGYGISIGVQGDGGSHGVLGQSHQGWGVRGNSYSDLGVHGYTLEGEAGVLGQNISSGYESFGVLGIGGVGVKGKGKIGVVGQSSSGGHGAVYGQHTGTSGYGVVGDGKGESGAGVLGRNSSGYGGEFEGGKAQLRLKPAAGTPGKPSGAHAKGEVYMDSAGTLFICVASSTGTTAAKWKRVSATLV